METVLTNMRRVSGKITNVISLLLGERFPFYYITEYPRSGGTWIAHMVSDYLQIAFPKLSIFPIGFECVLHNHWQYSSRLKPVIYVVRDGRDVAVSMFFYALRHIANGEHVDYFSRRFKSLRYTSICSDNHLDVFPQFIEEWFQHPVGCRQSWDRHVTQWIVNRNNVFVVKYEDMHSDTFEFLSRVIRFLTKEKLDTELVEYTIRKFSFAKQTGRSSGEENTMSKKRKGIVGDWRNIFSKQSGKIFQSNAGDILLQLGYERESDWYKSLSG